MHSFGRDVKGLAALENKSGSSSEGQRKSYDLTNQFYS